MPYTGKATQILVGAAAVYISVEDSTTEDWPAGGFVPLPTEVTGDDAKSYIEIMEAADDDWTAVGYTSDGLELQYTPDFVDINVDQILDAAKIFKQGQTMSLATTLAEATLEHLMIAWGQGRSTLKEGNATPVTAFEGPTLKEGEEQLAMSSGELGDEPTERSIVFVGPGPRTIVASANKKTERVYHVRRALQVEASTHSLKRSEMTGVPVSFRLLPVIAQSPAGYGSIRTRVIV